MTTRHLITLLLITSPAAAQIEWAAYALDPTRLDADPSVGALDTQEKDYAWADLDHDGDIDLVVARKQPYTTSGRFPNVLLLNEGGVLVDRSAALASAADVPGDEGFLTPTNDRDVVIADVTGDGWPDVVTSTTQGSGLPKAISHPRVYVNLGSGPQGQWLGLRYEEARIPDFGTPPNFTAVSAGDVDGDGDLDLYFAHNQYGPVPAPDLNDRLLINDGSGFFVDESAMRMTPQQLESGLGASVHLADMNGNGALDIVKTTTVGIQAPPPSTSITYNDPSAPGLYAGGLTQQAYGITMGAPYFSQVGDLNADGRLDLVISDDAQDRFLINEGNDPFGRVQWSTPYPFLLGTTDDGFASNSLIVDLDGDGWQDVLICDVDVDIPGCTRRLHIYRNQAPSVQGAGQLLEESGNGWTAATGMLAGQLTGAHDVAVFDLDGDGDQDIVLGRCSGTDVWVNQKYTAPQTLGVRYCSPAIPNSTGSPAYLAASGSDVALDNDLTLTATGVPAQQFGYFLGSTVQAFIPQPGGSLGNLCLGGVIGRFRNPVQNSGAAGSFSLQLDLTQFPAPLAPNAVAGETWAFQGWFRDAQPQSMTTNFTDGVAVTLR